MRKHMLLAVVAFCAACDPSPISPTPVPTQELQVEILGHEWTREAVIERYQDHEGIAAFRGDVPEGARNVNAHSVERLTRLNGAHCILNPGGAFEGALSFLCSYYRYDITTWVPLASGDALPPNARMFGEGKNTPRLNPAPDINTCDEVVIGCERVVGYEDAFTLVYRLANTREGQCLTDEATWRLYDVGKIVVIPYRGYGNGGMPSAAAVCNALQEAV